MKRALFLSLGVFIAATPAQAQELSLHLTFEELVNDVAKDSSPFGNDATFTGNVKLIEGPFGNALEFDGASSGQIPDHDSLDVVDAMTISLWANLEFGEAIQSGVEKGPSWATGEYNLAPVYNGGSILQAFDLPDECDDDNIGPSIQTGDWHFLAGTWDGDQLTLYVDGKVEAEMPCEGELTPNDQPLYIGARGGNQRFALGALDEIRLYKVALTQEEIQRDMNETASLAVDPSGKLATTWGALRSAVR